MSDSTGRRGAGQRGPDGLQRRHRDRHRDEHVAGTRLTGSLLGIGIVVLASAGIALLGLGMSIVAGLASP